MDHRRNAMTWDGSPGHYEVWYVTFTDPGSGIGAWIRLTLLAPDSGAPTASLWFSVMRPGGEVVARKATWPADQLQAEADPFRVSLAGATLDDHGFRGGFDDVAWDLRWPPGAPYGHVHPLLERLRIAKTVLTLPQGDVEVHGTLGLPGGRELDVAGARLGQAHLWGAKHATRWAWAHCGDFTDLEGAPVPDTFLDGVSVIVPRLGRQVGPSTPVVGRLLGEDFAAIAAPGVLRAPSAFSLTTWTFEATQGRRRVAADVSAPRDGLAGVTYTDPDGEHAHCYNSEIASMRVSVFDRTDESTAHPWVLRQSLVSDGRAHFEYAQREPVAGAALHLA